MLGRDQVPVQLRVALRSFGSPLRRRPHHPTRAAAGQAGPTGWIHTTAGTSVTTPEVVEPRIMGLPSEATLCHGDLPPMAERAGVGAAEEDFAEAPDRIGDPGRQGRRKGRLPHGASLGLSWRRTGECTDRAWRWHPP